MKTETPAAVLHTSELIGTRAAPRVGLDLPAAVLELLVAEPLVDEAELHRRLLHALPEILLVESEAELAVLQHVVGAGLVIPSAGRLLIHELKPGRDAKPGVAGGGSCRSS